MTPTADDKFMENLGKEVALEVEISRLYKALTKQNALIKDIMDLYDQLLDRVRVLERRSQIKSIRSSRPDDVS